LLSLIFFIAVEQHFGRQLAVVASSVVVLEPSWRAIVAERSHQPNHRRSCQQVPFKVVVGPSLERLGP
jgi:hypothetical protein